MPEPAPSKPLAIRGPDGVDVYSNDFLPGRPAGPTRPNEPVLAPEKDPNEVPLILSNCALYILKMHY